MARRRRRRGLQSGWLAIVLLAAISLVVSYPWHAGIVFLVALIAAVMTFLGRQARQHQLARIGERKERSRLEAISAARLDVIDQMTGEEFEDLVAGLLDILGYRADVTKRSRDGGVDVIAEKDGERIAIQTKRYGSSVGIKAVQEAIGGMYHYECSRCMVVTNSTYSRDAIELAAKSPCILIDRAGLVDIINKARAALGRGVLA